jgi:hypothetical protein
MGLTVKVSLILAGIFICAHFVPLSSSGHHVELNVKSQSNNARYALMTLANEMASNRKTTEPAGRKNFKGYIHTQIFCDCYSTGYLVHKYS